MSERPECAHTRSQAHTHSGAVCGKSSFSNRLSQAVPVMQSQKKKEKERETGRSLAYLVVFILVGDLQRLHGLDHGLHGGEDVLVDQPGEASLVLVRVSAAMDDPHLLDESALPALPGPCGRRIDRHL